jgi:uncharacterized protein (TIGR03086 family)
MADLVELFRRSTAHFGALVSSVPDRAWHDPTPCRDWDVRALVNHVVGEQLWAPHLVAGETIEQVGDRYDGDVLGTDPAAAWAEAVGPSVAAFAEPGAVERTVHLSYGDESCREYLTQMVTDAAVHGWDLATAVGGDTTIDADTVEALWAAWSPREELIRASGVFGESVEVADDAPLQTRLLALLGRRG